MINMRTFRHSFNFYSRAIRVKTKSSCFLCVSIFTDVVFVFIILYFADSSSKRI